MPGGLDDSQLAMNLLQRGDDLLEVPAPSEDDLDDADTAPLPRPSTSSLESEAFVRRRNQRRDKSYIGSMVDAEKEWMAYEREVEARSNQLSQRLVQLLEGVLAEAHMYNQIHAAEAEHNERRLRVEERTLALREEELRLKRLRLRTVEGICL